MWESIVELDGPQTVWCMCITCWIHKATNPHSEYVILTAFPLPQWLQYLNIHYTCIAYLVCLCVQFRYTILVSLQNIRTWNFKGFIFLYVLMLSCLLVVTQELILGVFASISWTASLLATKRSALITNSVYVFVSLMDDSSTENVSVFRRLPLVNAATSSRKRWIIFSNKTHFSWVQWLCCSLRCQAWAQTLDSILISVLAPTHWVLGDLFPLG